LKSTHSITNHGTDGSDFEKISWCDDLDFFLLFESPEMEMAALYPFALKTGSTHAIDVAPQYLILNTLEEETSCQLITLS